MKLWSWLFSTGFVCFRRKYSEEKYRRRREFILGSLSNDDGNSNENVTRKYIFISFVLLRDYFNSLNFYKYGELSRNQIGRSGVQVKKENEKFTVVRSRSPQKLERGHFTLLFCRRQRNVPKCSSTTCRAIVFAH